MRTLIHVRKFRDLARTKRNPSSPVFHVNSGWAEDVEGAFRTKRFVFSDGRVDRMGDTIAPDGWDLDDFTRNPVALWAHSSIDPPIGRARNVGVVRKRLMGDIEFATPDIYPFADTIFRLVDGRFINAVSVGFLPLKFAFSSDPARPGGIDFKEQVLLEISVCPIPANPNALGEARAKGIDTRPLSRWAENTLDAGGNPMFGRGGLVRLRDAAKEPARTGITRSRAAADLAKAAEIRFRLGPNRRAADLRRAAAIRREIYGDPGADFGAIKAALEKDADLRRRDRFAAVGPLEMTLCW